MSDLPSHHVLIKFGDGIPAGLQGEVMLAMEKSLRARGVAAEIFKEPVEDDVKLRRSMTPGQRAKL